MVEAGREAKSIPPSELGWLAREINTMATRIDEATSERDKMREKLQAMLLRAEQAEATLHGLRTKIAAALAGDEPRRSDADHAIMSDEIPF